MYIIDWLTWPEEYANNDNPVMKLNAATIRNIIGPMLSHTAAHCGS